jgi:TolB-like protein
MVTLLAFGPIFQAVRRGTALKVLGRAASFQFRGPRKVVSQVAAEFRATHVLDGSVRRHERGCGSAPT